MFGQSANLGKLAVEPSLFAAPSDWERIGITAWVQSQTFLKKVWGFPKGRILEQSPLVLKNAGTVYKELLG